MGEKRRQRLCVWGNRGVWGETGVCAGGSPHIPVRMLSQGKHIFLSPKVAHPPSILSPNWGSSPDPNQGSRVLTPLCGLKSCRESWRWKRHLAGAATRGGVRFPRNKGAREGTSKGAGPWGLLPEGRDKGRHVLPA